MSNVKSYYEQEVRLLKEENKQMQQDLEMLMAKCTALNAEYGLLKTEYDEKLGHLIGSVIKLKHVKCGLRTQIEMVEEQSLQLMHVMGGLMRQRKRELTELDLLLVQIQQHTSQKKMPSKAASKRQKK